jgi:tRNA nucleotidyltransferase/poly(A) polymerase
MRSFENHIQWSAVKGVCDRLKSSGFEALLAGGSVRDLIMGRDPNDFDVATDATPDQIESLFAKSIGVGKAFGVIVIPFADFQIEVATFREDLEYKDGRHPVGVKFSTAEADAKRRDFTINALFLEYDNHNVIDFVGGETDIRNKLIKTVGDARARFDEDKLRLLRAVRFSAQLGFSIESATLKAIYELAPQIVAVSRERIRDELVKILKSDGRTVGLDLLFKTELLKAAFPEVATGIGTHFDAWLKRFDKLTPNPSVDLILNAALMLFFMPALGATKDRKAKESLLKENRLDSQTVRSILFINENVEKVLKSEMRKGERALILLDRDAQTLLMLAAILAPEYSLGTDRILKLKEEKAEAEKCGDAYLSGDDLKSAGIAAGPKFSEVLREARLLQLEHGLKSREDALSWLKLQS